MARSTRPGRGRCLTQCALRHAGALILALAAAPAAAGQDESAPSASVSVQTVPGGDTFLFNNPTEAQRACVSAGGYFGLQERRLVCTIPRSPLRSTRTDPAPPTAPAHPSGSDARRRTGSTSRA